MNSIRALSLRSRRSRAAIVPAGSRPDLGWIHDGVRFRVTVWPEVRFEREVTPGKWIASEMGETVFAAAALGVTPQQWRRYLEYVPAEERLFLERFEFGRVAAWHVITHCPALLVELGEVPALVPFLVVHPSLRGGDAPRWTEI